MTDARTVTGILSLTAAATSMLVWQLLTRRRGDPAAAQPPPEPSSSTAKASQGAAASSAAASSTLASHAVRSVPPSPEPPVLGAHALSRAASSAFTDVSSCSGLGDRNLDGSCHTPDESLGGEWQQQRPPSRWDSFLSASSIGPVGQDDAADDAVAGLRAGTPTIPEAGPGGISGEHAADAAGVSSAKQEHLTQQEEESEQNKQVLRDEERDGAQQVHEPQRRQEADDVDQEQQQQQQGDKAEPPPPQQQQQQQHQQQQQGADKKQYDSAQARSAEASAGSNDADVVRASSLLAALGISDEADQQPTAASVLTANGPVSPSAAATHSSTKDRATSSAGAAAANDAAADGAGGNADATGKADAATGASSDADSDDAGLLSPLPSNLFGDVEAATSALVTSDAAEAVTANDSHSSAHSKEKSEVGVLPSPVGMFAGLETPPAAPSGAAAASLQTVAAAAMPWHQVTGSDSSQQQQEQQGQRSDGLEQLLASPSAAPQQQPQSGLHSEQQQQQQQQPEAGSSRSAATATAAAAAALLQRHGHSSKARPSFSDSTLRSGSSKSDWPSIALDDLSRSNSGSSPSASRADAAAAFQDPQYQPTVSQQPSLAAGQAPGGSSSSSPVMSSSPLASSSNTAGISSTGEGAGGGSSLGRSMPRGRSQRMTMLGGSAASKLSVASGTGDAASGAVADPHAGAVGMGQQQQQQHKRAKQEGAGGSPVFELQVLAGPAAGQIFAFGDAAQELVVGRLPECAISIPDQEISGKHACIRWSAPDHCWHLVDAGSLNGTILNGTVVSKAGRLPGNPVPLSDGDAVEFGSVTRALVHCSPSATAAKRHHAEDAAAASASPRSSRLALETRSHTWHPSRGPSHPPGPQLISTTSSNSLERRSFSHQEPPSSPSVALEPASLAAFGPCRLEAAVQRKVGSDHRRAGTGSEDLAHWEAPFRQFEQACLFCVFDGHHGRGAAEQAADLLPAQISQHAAAAPMLQAADNTAAATPAADDASAADDAPAAGATPASAVDADAASSPAPAMLLSTEGGISSSQLEAAFLATDAALSSDDGCTATVVLLEGQPDGSVALQVANVGDSNAVFVDLGSGHWQQLTEDHRIAANPVEQARLQAKSGQAAQQRLFGLNIARMLGDRFLKEEDVGFSAQPHVSARMTIPPHQEAVIVIASDGLWDVISCERAAQLVAKAGSGPPSAVAETLMAYATQQRSRDDVTIVMLRVLRGAVAEGSEGGGGGSRGSNRSSGGGNGGSSGGNGGASGSSGGASSGTHSATVGGAAGDGASADGQGSAEASAGTAAALPAAAREIGRR